MNVSSCSSLPADVPGMVGPMSVKEFLQRYFFLRVVYGGGGGQPHGIVCLPATPYAVFVYVAAHAPPPPPLSQTRQQQQDLSSIHSVNCSLDDTNTTTTGSSAVAALDIASLASRRPIACAALKQHAFWETLFAIIGPSAVGFMLGYCSTVAQYRPGQGGLFLFGVSLTALVGGDGGGGAAGGGRQRARPPSWGEDRGKRRQSSACSTRTTFPIGKKRRLEHRGPPRSPQIAVLLSTTLSKTSLLDDRCWSQQCADRFQWTTGAATGAGCVIDDTVRQACIRGMCLDAWHIRHHRGGSVTTAALLRGSSLKQRHRRCAQWELLDTVLQASCPQWIPSVVFPCSTFSRSRSSSMLRGSSRETPTRTAEDTNPVNKVGDAAAATAAGEAISEHVRRVIRTFMRQWSLQVNARGAALWVAHRLAHGKAASSGQGNSNDNSHPPVDNARASVAVVVQYLRRIFQEIKWTDGVGGSERTTSFWDGTHVHHDEPAGRSSPLSSCSICGPLDALLLAVSEWLSLSQLRTFSLHQVLDSVKVNRVPWLSGCRITGNPKQRSMMQQRLWMEFCHFLFVGPIPIMIRFAFHVTRSPREWNTLQYYVRDGWEAMFRREVGAMMILRREEGKENEKQQKRQSRVRRHSKIFSGWSIKRTLTLVRQPLSSFFSPAAAVACPDPLSIMNNISSLPMSLVVCRPEHVRLAALQSPMGFRVLYSSIRLLPDGHKMRPIATIRCTSVEKLKGMTLRWYARRRRRSKLSRIQRRGADEEDIPCGDGGGGVTAASTGVEEADAHPPPRVYKLGASPSSPVQLPPNRDILLIALQCLICGKAARRSLLGHHHISISNRTHRDEYRSWLHFIVSASSTVVAGSTGDYDDELVMQQGPTVRPQLHCVRADASRCYDRLPQAKVLETIRSLLSYASFARVPFAVVHFPRPNYLDDSSPSPPPPPGLSSRRWCTTITCEDHRRGVVPDIPCGWILHEIVEELQDEQPPPPAGHHLRRDSVGCDVRSTAWTPGDFIRSVLEQHVHQHFVTLGGVLYKQRVGIPQGSAVATILCDTILEAVDEDLSAVLETYDAPSLVMRRVDDVLVASLSYPAAAACHAKLRAGYLEDGFTSNPSKMKFASSSSSSSGGGYGEAAVSSSSSLPPVVGWCGLLWHLSSWDFSVDWSRLLATHRGRGSEHPPPLAPSVRPRTESDITLSILRLCTSLRARAPLTVFCNRINSRARVLQTLCECALIGTRGMIDRISLSLRYLRPHVRVLLRPMSVFTAALQRHVLVKQRELAAVGSSCSVSATDVKFIVLAAAFRNVQISMRWLTSRSGASRHSSDDNNSKRVTHFWWTLNHILQQKIDDSTTTSSSSLWDKATVEVVKQQNVFEKAEEAIRSLR